MMHSISKFTQSLILNYIVLLAVGGCSATEQILRTEGYTLEKVNYYKEKLPILDSIKVNKSKNKHLAAIYLFEEFEDTLSIFVNKRLASKTTIYKRNNPAESSGYSGINYTVKYTEKGSL